MSTKSTPAGHQTTVRDEHAQPGDRRQPVLSRKRDNEIAVDVGMGIRRQEPAAVSGARRRRSAGARGATPAVRRPFSLASKVNTLAEVASRHPTSLRLRLNGPQTGKSAFLAARRGLGFNLRQSQRLFRDRTAALILYPSASSRPRNIRESLPQSSTISESS